MTSTLWFWIVCIVVLLFIIWFVRRFLGRIILLFVCLVILFTLWKWIAPVSAQKVINWLCDIPENVTNFVNKDILHKDIVLPTIGGGDLDIALSDDEDSGSISKESYNLDDEDDDSNHSWFSRIFKKKKKDTVEVDVTLDEEEWSDIVSDDKKDSNRSWFSRLFNWGGKDEIKEEIKEDESGVVDEVEGIEYLDDGVEYLDDIDNEDEEAVVDSELTGTIEESIVVVIEEVKNPVEVEEISNDKESSENEVQSEKISDKVVEKNDANTGVVAEKKSTTSSSARGYGGLSAAEIQEVNEIFN